MHARDRLLDGLLCILQLAAAAHLVRWRVSHARVLRLHHGALVLWHALLAQGLVVTHAKHVDRLVVLSANCILAPPGRQRVHVASHLAGHHLLACLPTQIVTHFNLIARKTAYQSAEMNKNNTLLKDAPPRLI